MSLTLPARRPNPDEHVEYFGLYIDKVPDGPIVELMESQIDEIHQVLSSIDENTAMKLHEPYTWTIKQVVGHLIEVERVFAYRGLRFASHDLRTILGMEHLEWMNHNDYATPTLAELTEELVHCRRANVCLFSRLKPEAWDNIGDVEGAPMSVRALAYCLVGHITHHLEIVRKRVAS